MINELNHSYIHRHSTRESFQWLKRSYRQSHAVIAAVPAQLLRLIPEDTASLHLVTSRSTHPCTPKIHGLFCSLIVKDSAQKKCNVMRLRLDTAGYGWSKISSYPTKKERTPEVFSVWYSTCNLVLVQVLDLVQSIRRNVLLGVGVGVLVSRHRTLRIPDLLDNA
jgi:hypothetical protein